MDATTILQSLAAGKTTAQVELTSAVTAINAKHGTLNVAAEILEAEAAAQLRNLPDGPLKGLPISVKECYGLAGKTIRSGSVRMKPILCKEDATVVKKL